MSTLTQQHNVHISAMHADETSTLKGKIFELGLERFQGDIKTREHSEDLVNIRDTAQSPKVNTSVHICKNR